MRMSTSWRAESASWGHLDQQGARVDGHAVGRTGAGAGPVRGDVGQSVGQPFLSVSRTVTGPHLGVHPETGLRAFIAFNGARKRNGLRDRSKVR